MSGSAPAFASPVSNPGETCPKRRRRCASAGRICRRSRKGASTNSPARLTHSASFAPMPNISSSIRTGLSIAIARRWSRATRTRTCTFPNRPRCATGGRASASPGRRWRWRRSLTAAGITSRTATIRGTIWCRKCPRTCWAKPRRSRPGISSRKQAQPVRTSRTPRRPSTRSPFRGCRFRDRRLRRRRPNPGCRGRRPRKRYRPKDRPLRRSPSSRRPIPRALSTILRSSRRKLRGTVPIPAPTRPTRRGRRRRPKRK